MTNDLNLSGLTQHEARLRLKTYGKNLIKADNSSTFIDIFLSQFPTVINGVLFAAAVFSFFIGNIIDGGFIIAIILINGILGFIQEFRAKKSIEKLKSLTSPLARVVRDGKEIEIEAELLVPGDVVIIAEGGRVPADGVIIDTGHLEIDESVLTGESLALIKNNSDGVYMGTLVTRGSGYIKVEGTGSKTKFGQIAGTLASIQEDKTPLQKNLDGMGKFLSIIAVAFGLLIIPIGLFYGEAIVPLILVGASIGVAAIPEGLPAVVTIAFAVGAHRMAARGAVVKKMAAIETLGAVQVILSDKTGTITQNLMRVKKYWLADQNKLPQFYRGCLLGNTASLVEKGSGHDFEVVGDQTDGALLLWTKEQKDLDVVEDEKGEIVDEYVFDPSYKTITTVWKNKRVNYVYVRGAPEAIISKCRLSREKKREVEKQFENFAKEGLRTIALAYKTTERPEKSNREHLESELTFLGFAGIYDPPRPEIVEAIKKSRSAGIQVIMVTGDNELTALSLARDIGLIEKEEDVISGDEMAKMSDEILRGIILKTRVFARTQPEQKLRLVSILKKMGVVIGVTGDGVNDALALKKADVGVAMGQGGTDVAREEADIVLTNNSFGTMIKAIEEGRVIYKNIVNAVVYLISGNLAEITLVFTANLLHLPFPLLPTQILWINLVTDSLPALALATGARDQGVLNKKPRNPHEALLNPRRLAVIAIIGFGLAGFLLWIYIQILPKGSEAQSRTVVFNLLILFHLLFVMAIGYNSLRRGNMFLVFTVVLIFILQMIITTVPFFQQIFHLEL